MARLTPFLCKRVGTVWVDQGMEKKNHWENDVRRWKVKKLRIGEMKEYKLSDFTHNADKSTFLEWIAH